VFDQQRTRRRVLLGTGTLAAGTIGSIALTAGKTTATVDGSFSIPDADQTLAGETLNDVRLSATAEWSFDSNTTMTGVEIELHVGQGADTLDLIARQVKENVAKASLTGTTELNGSLISASDFDIEDFRPSDGELTRTVVAELRLYVLRDGTVEAEAKSQTTFDVTVRDGEITVSASVGGSGEVAFDTGSS